ncbi:hypothetical protein [Hydrogenivirga sp. 128-5-R1-1]|uniref:hypothetical protein n=1 Tax=Hydrogenivirga sp. 128-5-R1-1 TaxID=392423 RepID=UPI00015F381E|nr:hypothetical protein [Hydrogenivirga sp. 128-5-R1-1]EDP76455.1 hypothetical protein HG1285_02573 [Hydrogenivirga sp. 128-5-R1-1]
MEIEDFNEEIEEALRQELLYQETLNALRNISQGEKISKLLITALSDRDTAFASVLAQFLLKDTLSKVLLLYLRFTEEGRVDSIRTMAKLLSEEDAPQDLAPLPDLLIEGKVEEAHDLLEGYLRKVREEPPYGYMFPTETLDQAFSALADMLTQDFSEEVLGEVRNSVATCSNLASTVREAVLGDEEGVEGALLTSYVSSLVHIAFTDKTSSEEKERSLNIISRSVEEYGEVVGDMVAMTLSIDTLNPEREVWKRALSLFDTETQAMILTCAKVNNPVLKIPLEGFRDAWTISSESVAPLLTEEPQFSELSSQKVIKALIGYELYEEEIAYLIPLWMPFGRREELAQIFRSFDDMRLQEDILRNALITAYEEDKDTIKESVELILSRAEDDLRESLKDMI